MKGKHAERWKKAEDKEWTGMLDQDTFEDVLINDLPPHTKMHYLHWLYKCKVDKDKARLVFDGSNQASNTYNETYSPTARLTSIRVLLAVAAKMNYPLYSDDATQAFLVVCAGRGAGRLGVQCHQQAHEPMAPAVLELGL